MKYVSICNYNILQALPYGLALTIFHTPKTLLKNSPKLIGEFLNLSLYILLCFLFHNISNCKLMVYLRLIAKLILSEVLSASTDRYLQAKLMFIQTVMPRFFVVVAISNLKFNLIKF